MKCPYCHSQLFIPQPDFEPDETNDIEDCDNRDIKSGYIKWWCSLPSCPGLFFDKDLQPVRFYMKTRLETMVMISVGQIPKKEN